MEKHSLIRTIYLYLFTLVGLVLLTIGGVRFVDMGLKAFVFTKADEEQRITYKQSPPVLIQIAQVEKLQDQEELSEEERVAIKEWLIEYKNWEERMSEIDPVTARRHKNASLNLAMILIGLPLYLYHWRIIKRETENKKEYVKKRSKRKKK